MHSTSRLILLIIVMSLSLTSTAGTAERLDSLFSRRYGPAGAAAPGGAVIVTAGDSTVYEAYFGMADMASRIPVGPNTTFNIASVSKQFTVVGLLQLASRGEVDINAPLSRWFGKEFPQKFWSKITPAHIASQSSGIPDTRDRSSRKACIYANDSTSAAYFPEIDSLLFEPGSAYDYVNPTFILLSKIIERTSGRKFEDYQQTNIFDAAGMAESYYFSPDITPGNQSHAYEPDSVAAGGWREFDYGEETFFATRPDGGIYSTARDMAKWEKALRDNALIPAAMRDEAYRPHTDVASSRWCDYQRRPYTSYGLGWFVESKPGRPVKVFHTGDNGGYQAYVAKYPSCGVTVIVLENRHDRPRREMAEQIEQILTEEKLLK